MSSSARRALHFSPAPVIAIDGPSASGKGTLALQVARALRFHYLESGALYRIVAHAALQEGVPLTNEARLSALSARLDPVFRDTGIYLGEVDVSQAIRAEACGNAASQLAAFPRVRAALLERQRRFRRPPGLVAEGRDMGTVVFPDATLKVYLTASAEVRANRRHKQLMGKGIHANLAAILQDIERRDGRDVSRSTAPLQKAADAFVVDSTFLSIEEMTQAVLDRYQEIRAQRAS